MNSFNTQYEFSIDDHELIYRLDAELLVIVPMESGEPGVVKAFNLREAPLALSVKVLNGGFNYAIGSVKFEKGPLHVRSFPVNKGKIPFGIDPFNHRVGIGTSDLRDMSRVRYCYDLLMGPIRLQVIDNELEIISAEMPVELTGAAKGTNKAAS